MTNDYRFIVYKKIELTVEKSTDCCQFDFLEYETISNLHLKSELTNDCHFIVNESFELTVE